MAPLGTDTPQVYLLLGFAPYSYYLRLHFVPNTAFADADILIRRGLRTQRVLLYLSTSHTYDSRGLLKCSFLPSLRLCVTRGLHLPPLSAAHKLHVRVKATVGPSKGHPPIAQDIKLRRCLWQHMDILFSFRCSPSPPPFTPGPSPFIRPSRCRPASANRRTQAFSLSNSVALSMQLNGCAGNHTGLHVSRAFERSILRQLLAHRPHCHCSNILRLKLELLGLCLSVRRARACRIVHTNAGDVRGGSLSWGVAKLKS